MVDINWVSHAYPVQASSRTCEMPYRRSYPRYSNVISEILQPKFADWRQPVPLHYISM